MKNCPKCKIEVDVATVPPSRQVLGDWRCLACKGAYSKKYNQAQRKTWNQQGMPRKNKLQFMLYACRARAKQKGIECTVSIEDLNKSMGTHCPILGIPYDFHGKCKGLAPSLDRIDNTGGYTPENIQVISLRANKMKGNASPADLVAFADWVYSMRISINQKNREKDYGQSKYRGCGAWVRAAARREDQNEEGAHGRTRAHQ